MRMRDVMTHCLHNMEQFRISMHQNFCFVLPIVAITVCWGNEVEHLRHIQTQYKNDGNEILTM